MNIDFYEALIPGMIDGFSAIAFGILPIFLWILVPAIVLNRLIGGKEAWNFGALLGLIAYFTVGPEASLNLF